MGNNCRALLTCATQETDVCQTEINKTSKEIDNLFKFVRVQTVKLLRQIGKHILKLVLEQKSSENIRAYSTLLRMVCLTGLKTARHFILA